MYKSTKKFGPISTTHRNWHAAFNECRDSRKCSWVHGYSRYIQFTFEGELDDKSWIVDFGDLKFIKQWLDDNWDHKILLASDDPLLSEFKKLEEKAGLTLTVIPFDERNWNPSIEGSCKWVYDSINPILIEKTKGRCYISKVEIWEHEFNTAIYEP